MQINGFLQQLLFWHNFTESNSAQNVEPEKKCRFKEPGPVGGNTKDNREHRAKSSSSSKNSSCGIAPEQDDSPVAILNPGEEDEMLITGYRRSKLRTTLCWIVVLITCGLLRLILHWWKHWHLIATHCPCPPRYAEKMLVTDKYLGKHTTYFVHDIITLNEDSYRKMQLSGKNEWLTDVNFDAYGQFLLSIHHSGGTFEHTKSIKFFKCKHLRYVWNNEANAFMKLMGLDLGVPVHQLHEQDGIHAFEQSSRRLVYGLNQIDIPIRSTLTLLILEILNPFYVFQVFSVCLWFAYSYYYYAILIILMTVYGVTMSIKQTRENQIALHSRVVHDANALVIRDLELSAFTVDSRLLVPGDILEIPTAGCTMHCDAILLTGNCILDESMLTGESVPVTKTPIPKIRDIIFNAKEHSNHMLYCGTKIIQTRFIDSEKVLAIVINTGNKTAKGELIRSILYPPPVDYKFERDSYKYIMVLGVIAFIGFLATLVMKVMRGVSPGKIAIEALDLITIAVPPALPAAMAVGRMYSQKRLRASNIFCISPRSITISGSIDCVCFDKTGTLTEDGLDMWGIVPKSSANTFQIPLQQMNRCPHDNLLFGMVTCHSITLMNNELKGDPLDLKMFESTGWTLEEANVADGKKYDMLHPAVVRPPSVVDAANDGMAIVRQFSFSSSLQRMSVVTRRPYSSHFNVYTKGSPEMILTLCRPETIPEDYMSTLDVYSQQGYRVIAVAHKPLDQKINFQKIVRIAREAVECDLEFCGFVVLENRLKANTTQIIGELKTARIRTIMVTGDNILTAVSVGRDCGMIDTDQNVIIVTASRSTIQPNEELDEELEDELGDMTYETGETRSSLAPPPDDSYTLHYTLAAGNKQQAANNMARLRIIDGISSTSSFDTTTQETTIAYDVENGNKTPATDEEDEAASPVGPPLDCDVGEQSNCAWNNYRFAMVGSTWAVLKREYPELLPRFLTRGTIFARMSPDQKQALILELQQIGYYVAMCGDGANDCGALKAAHTGISLSEAESSVASPFTSRDPTIACVPRIIQEGRAALVTLLGTFKYMAAYSLVQFASVFLLYTIDSNLTDFEFLYIDLCIISAIAFFFGQTRACDGPIYGKTPLASLVSLAPISSLVLQLIAAITFQLIGWFHLHVQTWFVPFNSNEVNNNENNSSNYLGCYENYTIFIISCFQYIILAFVYSKGAPYRKSILSNKGLMCGFILNLLFVLYLAIDPHQFIINLFGLVVANDLRFRLYLIFYGICNFMVAIFIETLIVDYLLYHKFRYWHHSIERSHRRYLAIENKLRSDLVWPPLSSYADNERRLRTIDNSLKHEPNNVTRFWQMDEGTMNPNAPPFDKASSILGNFFDDATDIIPLENSSKSNSSSPPEQNVLNKSKFAR